ncbi:MAG TPA: transketolase [Terriglobales bacterium]|nr:transketolase [Terriglobales bacterium]
MTDINLRINTIRMLSADAVEYAKSGHPGLPMGAAAIGYTLWTGFLKFNPRNPSWPDRDRFVLSAGHGSMLLYSLLYLTGYDLSLDDIKHFRKLESRTPGHPERGVTPGVEVSTGPLGQGFANGVGLAIAEAWLAARYNRENLKIVDHYTYVLCSDGDLMEGISYEAASLAGHLQLGKLICLYDRNRVSLAGSTDLTFTEDVAARFQAAGWHTTEIKDGNDTVAIAAAIRAAQAATDKPSMILVDTHIGYGSPDKQDSFTSHGSPLGAEELLKTKKNLGWPSEEKFYIPEEALSFFRQAVPKGDAAEKSWRQKFEDYRRAFPKEAGEFEMILSGRLPDDWAADVPKWTPKDKAIATRAAGGKVLNGLAKRISNIVGGSADLNPSTETALAEFGNLQPVQLLGRDAQGGVSGAWGYAGRNIAFGVREHAMGSVANGLAAHGGIIPFTATFFTFYDYMKPSVRLAAISDLKVVFVFTHDSIAVGEDGPTHEPIEQLAAARSTPGLSVIRPADPTETLEAWELAVQHNGPTLLVLSRQAVPHLDRANSKEPGVAKGAYVLADSDGEPDVILIGTGSEVSLCMQAKAVLEKEQQYAVRVVSMPSWNLFKAQPASYRDQVLPPHIKSRVTVEAAASLGWREWAGDAGEVVAIDRFGASAPGPDVMAHFGFTADHVVAAAQQTIDRARKATPVEQVK